MFKPGAAVAGRARIVRLPATCSARTIAIERMDGVMETLPMSQ
jgi:hypothetical protein